MIYIFFDLGLCLLVILIAIILGTALGAIALNSILHFILIPAVIVLILAHLLIIVGFDVDIYNESESSTPFLMSGIILFSIGRLLRSFVEIVFFVCLCKGFLIDYVQCDGLLDKVFLFILFLIGLLEGFVIFFVSSLIDTQLLDNYHPALFIGIVSLLLSIIFFILVEFWITYCFSELFVDIPILKHIFGNISILGKIFNWEI